MTHPHLEGIFCRVQPWEYWLMWEKGSGTKMYHKVQKPVFQNCRREGVLGPLSSGLLLEGD